MQQCCKFGKNLSSTFEENNVCTNRQETTTVSGQSIKRKVRTCYAVCQLSCKRLLFIPSSKIVHDHTYQGSCSEFRLQDKCYLSQWDRDNSLLFILIFFILLFPCLSSLTYLQSTFVCVALMLKNNNFAVKAFSVLFIALISGFSMGRTPQQTWTVPWDRSLLSGCQIGHMSILRCFYKKTCHCFLVNTNNFTAATVL